MKKVKQLCRTLLTFVFLAALCGNFVFPVVNVQAAPVQGPLACGLLMAQWTFDQTPAPSNTTPAPSTSNVTASASASGVNGIGFQAAGSHTGNAWSGTGWSQTATPSSYFEFDVSTVGYTGISMSFWASRSGTGPQDVSAQYSSDGLTFTQVNSYTVNLNTAQQITIDLSSITSLDNNANFKFRIYGVNASGNGSLRVDDVTFSGCQPATPTPTATNTGTSTPTGTATNTPTPTPTRTPTSTPSSARSVIINEIAWGGTVASSTDEWFELYNNTGADINLNGWRLVADDGNPDIALSGTITAADP